MGKRIVLHVGAMKSGTSYLQTLLMDNKARLAEHGVVVPGARWGDQVAGVSHVLERQKVMRHIKVITASEEQARAQEILTAAGYNTSPNGRGLWVEVLPERKAAPLSVLYTADVDVLDVEL